MLYREAGDFKTAYAADAQIFPLRFDRTAFAILLAASFLLVRSSSRPTGRTPPSSRS